MTARINSFQHVAAVFSAIVFTAGLVVFSGAIAPLRMSVSMDKISNVHSLLIGLASFAVTAAILAGSMHGPAAIG